jgi:TetR/AcrR family transcriptional regulator, transcriptional repressor for nem operon
VRTMERLDTRNSLLSYATHLVRRRGYSAFSYADLATAVGIRKASIHHHFPTKEELGVEIVARYSQEFLAHLAEIDRIETDPGARLDRYVGLYRQGLVDDEACLCGMIAAETAAVPAAVAAGVATFFAANRAWLAEVVKAGQRAGAFRRRPAATTAAAALLTALQGAVFVARGIGDIHTFDEAAAATIELLHVERRSGEPTSRRTRRAG